MRGSDGPTTSDESGTELAMRDDTRVRQMARKHPGSLAASTIVSFDRAGELEAAANIQRLAVSYLDHAFLPHAGPKFPVTTERAENFGGSLGLADEWADNDRDGHHRVAIPGRRNSGPRRRRMERGPSFSK